MFHSLKKNPPLICLKDLMLFFRDSICPVKAVWYWQLGNHHHLKAHMRYLAARGENDIPAHQACRSGLDCRTICTFNVHEMNEVSACCLAHAPRVCALHFKPWSHCREARPEPVTSDCDGKLQLNCSGKTNLGMVRGGVRVSSHNWGEIGLFFCFLFFFSQKCRI